MKPRRPEHCKNCINFHNAGRLDPSAELKKYNSWCKASGKPAKDSVGWCKQHKAKVERDTKDNNFY